MGGVTGISYVRYQAPDLDLMEKFLVDFGLSRSCRTSSALYMRGTGGNHYIHVTELGDTPRGLGIGLRVKSRSDLEDIAAQADARVKESTEPGGGLKVVLADPNGFRVELLYGQQTLDALPVRAPLILNDAARAPRVGAVQRPDRGASHVARLEHSVLAGPEFDAALAFYRDLLGMKISDSIYFGREDMTVAAFLHCGLGSTYTDHHSIALLRSPLPGIDHSAFVALDWDDLMLGHQHLKQAGHRHEWGVGRHIMGSEIFDYWRDPFGQKLEHCVDGDMVNDDYKPSSVPISEDVLSVWSPPVSETFGEITALRGSATSTAG